MTKDAQLLAIDNGSQSIRAIVFDTRGNLIAKSQIALSYFSDQEGWCEQSPHYFWDALSRACQQLWTMDAVDKSAIKAVSVTTMRNTVINLDKDGEPLRPAILWSDQRKVKHIKPLKGGWDQLFKVIGVSNTINNFKRSCQAAWIAENQPELWQNTDKYLLLSGYLNYKLCGEFIDSTANQVGYIPFDFKKRDWAAKSSWKWQLAPVKREQLPELVEAGGPLGVISEEAALQTGIPQGLPLIAGGADKAAEVLGSGCIDADQACISYGTAATINITSQKFIEPIRFIPPYPSCVTGAYSLEHQIYRGYWMVNWFKEQFGHIEQSMAEQMGLVAEQLFDKAIVDIPPGSNGLMLQPYWSPGVKVPGPEARGSIIGFNESHTRAHMYRAILEGIAYGLRDGKESLEKRLGKKVQQLMVSGGGSQSDVAMQLTADIFNQTAIRPHTYETSALGAAINAAVGVGLFADYSSAVKAMCHHGTVFTPNPDNVARYDELYRQGYKKMYPKLRSIFQAIHRLD